MYIKASDIIYHYYQRYYQDGLTGIRENAQATVHNAFEKCHD